MHASDPDRDILEFGITGDMNRAMRLLMQRHGRAVHRYCCKQLNDAALADDVRQEVFIAALRALPRFEGRSTLRTWLFAIARHRTSDAAKRRRRRESREVELTKIVNKHDPGPSPIDSLDGMRLHERLIASISRLPEHLRAIILLRYQQGLTYGELTEIYGEKPGCLQGRSLRALGRLRLALERPVLLVPPVTGTCPPASHR